MAEAVALSLVIGLAGKALEKLAEHIHKRYTELQNKHKVELTLPDGGGDIGSGGAPWDAEFIGGLWRDLVETALALSTLEAVQHQIPLDTRREVEKFVEKNEVHHR